jgi:hypothetical protein
MRHPLIRAVWRIIARDEARHANLGWVLLDWIAPDLGEPERRLLAAAAAPVLETLRQGALSASRLPDGWFSETAVFAGFGDPGGRERYRAVAEEELAERVVAPLRRLGIPIT